MYSYKVLVLLLIAQSIPQHTDGQRQTKFFRKDYHYMEETQSFYKIHTIRKAWQDAKKTCALEGATLFYPEDKAELDAVSKYWQEKQPFTYVFIGVSSLLAKEVFETIDGIPISDVYNNWGPGQPDNWGGDEDCVTMQRNTGIMNDDNCKKIHPFICKKTVASLEWNAKCEMPNMDYVYNELLGRCYKFHLTPSNWTQAYRVCSAEQSYLAVINSKQEADYLVAITEQAPKDKVKGKFMAGAVFLGFHNRNNDGWTTTKGTSLADSGYALWGNQKPDTDDQKQCGSMLYSGLLNDVMCANKCFFICEHEVKSDFDERFGE